MYYKFLDLIFQSRIYQIMLRDYRARREYERDTKRENA